ncbi:MAG: hypothetical protein IK109_06835 [Clostridiales bacterium]|nr:hypothetical protein [Clostridiales bacterium]
MDEKMITKNIYTVRVLDSDDLASLFMEKAGKLTWLILLQKDVQWSAEAVIPDFSATDSFDLDIIFDDDFRSTTDVNVGDRFSIDFSIADKSAGIREVEVLAIRKDKPINHLQNKAPKNA